MNGTSQFSIIGRLTEEPKLKELSNGSKVVNIMLAVDRPYKDKEGNRITDFFPLSLWNNNAENICKISKKGALVNLTGYCSIKVEEKDGHKEYLFVPVITHYQHLVNKKEYVMDNSNEKDDELVND